ncbi:hypothetical protein MMC34_001846 [Xylographa carneopallida]|nr:hypothetical protein [Xylographa carneopallida]
MATSPPTPKYVLPTTISRPINLDPSAPGTIVRSALLIEALSNILGAIPMVFLTRPLLSLISSAAPSPLAISLTQWLGGLVCGLAAPLLLAYPNTKRAMESRTTVYLTLGAGEGVLIPVMLWQYMSEGQGSGLPGGFLLGAAGVLAATAVWRLWVMLVRPEWMGRYREEGMKGE